MTVALAHTNCIAFAQDNNQLRWAVVEGWLRSPSSIKFGTVEGNSSETIAMPPEIQSILKRSRFGVLVDERFVRHRLYRESIDESDLSGHLPLTEAFLAEYNAKLSSEDFCFGKINVRDSDDFIVSAISATALATSTRAFPDNSISPFTVTSLVHELPYALAYQTTFLEHNTSVIYASHDYCCQILYRNGSFQQAHIFRGDPDCCSKQLLVTYSSQDAHSPDNPILVCGPESTTFASSLTNLPMGAARIATLSLPWKQQSPVPATHLDVAGLAIRLFFEAHPTFDFRAESSVVQSMHQSSNRQLRSSLLLACAITTFTLILLAGVYAYAHINASRARVDFEQRSFVATEAKMNLALASASDEEQRNYAAILSRQTNVAFLLDGIGRSIPNDVTITLLRIDESRDDDPAIVILQGLARSAASLTSLSNRLSKFAPLESVNITRVASIDPTKHTQQSAISEIPQKVEFAISAVVAQVRGDLNG